MLREMENMTLQQSFVHAARKGEKLVSVDGGPAKPQVHCDGCQRVLDPPLAFTALGPPPEEGEEEKHFCGDCRAALLGPPCAACERPVSRADGLLALERPWHRSCLRCSDESCRALLGERHFAHEDKPYCRAHYLERAGERCARCGDVVDGGLRALGRASAETEKFYPQLLGLVAAVNAPPWVHALVRVASHFVPERTMRKLALCGATDTAEECAALCRTLCCTPDGLPDFLGGRAAPEGCLRLHT